MEGSYATNDNNSINMTETDAKRKLNKETRKKRTNDALKVLKNEIILQIKRIAIIIAIITIVVLLLCSSAMYILNNDEKNILSIFSKYL